MSKLLKLQKIYIFIFILLSLIFVSSIYFFKISEQNILKQAYKQEFLTVQNLTGALVALNPEVELEIVKVLNSDDKSYEAYGYEILSKYGYDAQTRLSKNKIYSSLLQRRKYELNFFAVVTILGVILILFLMYQIQQRCFKKIIALAEAYLLEDFSFAESQIDSNDIYLKGLVGQIFNILKQLGNQIQVKNFKLINEKESTKALVTDISHQLKTPIASLKLCFSIYEEATDEDEKQEFLNRCQTQIDKLEILINSLINISRLETAMIKLSPEMVSLNDILIKAVNQIYAKAKFKNIDIEMDEFQDCLLMLDKKWTIEAIVNILDNAIKYSNSFTKISIKVVPMFNFVNVNISDKGIGIEKAQYNKIFKRFYRVDDKIVKETEGSGVGLYLTRNILERQGGNIIVKSEYGHGSTFIIQLKTKSY